MPIIEHIWILLLAPVAGLLAWLVSGRAGRGRRPARLAAACSAALIVAALAGIFVGEVSALRVFVIDVSASTRGAADGLPSDVRAAASRLDKADRVAVIAFGRDAVVLLPPTPAGELPAVLPPPAGVDQDGTSIERALETALALFPAGAAGDVVFVTDGAENAGDATTLAARLAALGWPVHSLTISPRPRDDAWVEAVRAPSFVAAGQDIEFEVVAGASSPMHGKLVLLVNGQELTGPEPVDVLSRNTVFARRIVVPEPGLYTLTARLLCPGDATSENDSASAAVRVRGKLNVTHLSSGGERALADVLSKSGVINLRRASPDALAVTNDEILASDVIVLDDVSAASLAGRMEWLARFVRDAGRGLVVFGGRNSFGPGGYAETPLAGLLPVDPDPERQAAKPSSVVIVADRSGSMAEVVGDRQKIEFVREAVLRAGSEFGARTGERADELSVVAFNQSPEVLLERGRVGTSEGAAALRAAVAGMFPSGRTNIGPALDAARSVLAPSDLRRHIILVSDGQGQDKLDGPAVSARMKDAGITFSVLATSATMNDGLAALKTAADATGGRFVMLESIGGLPAAMARETRQIAGSLVREGAFAVARGPGASWSGGVPVPDGITGYVLTGARREAPLALVAGDAPVLAEWRRGLGRVVACTTSLDEWARDWPEAAAYLEGLVLWAGAAARPRALTVRLAVEEERVSITAEASAPLADGSLESTVFGPGGEISKVAMRQVGRLRYEAAADAGGAGTYVAKISSAKTGDVLGEGHTTVSYGPEWRSGGDTSVAMRLSRLTSGSVLVNLGGLPALAPSESGSAARRNVAYVLLCVAAAAFVVSSLR